MNEITKKQNVEITLMGFTEEEVSEYKETLLEELCWTPGSEEIDALTVHWEIYDDQQEDTLNEVFNHKSLEIKLFGYDANKYISVSNWLFDVMSLLPFFIGVPITMKSEVSCVIEDDYN